MNRQVAICGAAAGVGAIGLSVGLCLLGRKVLTWYRVSIKSVSRGVFSGGICVIKVKGQSSKFDCKAQGHSALVRGTHLT